MAYDDVGTRINTNNAGWFDEDAEKQLKQRTKQERNVQSEPQGLTSCRKAIKAKNEARKKCIVWNTRANKEEYMKGRNEAKWS